jgi:hypothetical protein
MGLAASCCIRWDFPVSADCLWKTGEACDSTWFIIFIGSVLLSFVMHGYPTCSHGLVIYLIFACTIEAWSYFLPRESARARWSVFGMLFYSTESLALLLLMPMKGRASSLNYYILPLRNNSIKETGGLQEYICEPFPSWLHGHLSDSPKLWAHWSGINGHSVVDCSISEKDRNTRHHKEGMA